MRNATLTKAGAYRIGAPELAGRTVQYTRLSQNKNAKHVFYKNSRVCGILSTNLSEILPEEIGTNHDAGLILRGHNKIK